MEDRLGNQYAWRALATVLSGTAAAQAIPLVGSLVLARLFAPTDFGVFSAWLGLTSLAAVAITGRYEMSLGLESDGDGRREAVSATVLVTLLGGFGLGVVSAALDWAGVGWLAGVDRILLWTFAPTAVLMALMQIWQQWAAIDGRYGELSAIRMVQAIGITGSQIIAGTLDATGTSLGLGHMLGVGLAIAFATKRMPMGALPGATVCFAFLSRQRRFPILALPADALNTGAAQLPVIIVANRFGAEAAGLLAMTMRTLGAPMSLLGAAVLDVFRRSAASAFKERGECRTEYLHTMKLLALIAVISTVVILMFGESLFVLAFGTPWRYAGTIAIWLMPMFALRFVASPLSYLFYVANKQHIDLLWQFGLLAMTLQTLLLFETEAATLQAYSAGYSAMYLIYLVLSYRFSGGASK